MKCLDEKHLSNLWVLLLLLCIIMCMSCDVTQLCHQPLRCQLQKESIDNEGRVLVTESY